MAELVECACCGRPTEAVELRVDIPLALYENLIGLAEKMDKPLSEVVQVALGTIFRPHPEEPAA